MAEFWKRGALDIEVRPVPEKARVELVLGIEADELTASHEHTLQAMLFALPRSVVHEVRSAIDKVRKKRR